MNLTLPHHLRPGTFIVIDGPAGSGATELLDLLWRAAHGLGHGPTPLFDRVPVFTALPIRPEWQRAHWEHVVHPALSSGRSVLMHGAYTEKVPIRPDVMFIANPGADVVLDHGVIRLEGHRGDLCEQMFVRLIERELYSARPPVRGRR